ncbi:MAG: hypothetical protein WC476_04815 [Phycisphaerae bacterium]|jgi:hypothetical protein
MAKRRKTVKRKKAPALWTTSEINLLKRLFPTNPTSKVAVKLKRKTDAVKKKASRMGLKKSRKYLKSLGKI